MQFSEHQKRELERIGVRWSEALHGFIDQATERFLCAPAYRASGEDLSLDWESTLRRLKLHTTAHNAQQAVVSSDVF